MDQNTVEGAAKEAKGKAEQTIGKTLGDAKTQVQGKIDEAAGNLQQSYSGMMQDLDDFLGRLRQRTREQPVTAILAAAAVGYLVGRVGRWL